MMIFEVIEFKILNIFISELVLVSLAVGLRRQGLHGARLGAVDKRVFHHEACGARAGQERTAADTGRQRLRPPAQ